MAPYHYHLDISSFVFGCGEKQHHIAKELSLCLPTDSNRSTSPCFPLGLRAGMESRIN